jgi:2',3'-cyclic-nucleotide 2'-phosphodiesterase/3'-nucleotidase
MKFTKKIALVAMVSSLAITTLMASGMREDASTAKLADFNVTNTGFNYNKTGAVKKGAATNNDKVVLNIAATSDIHGRIYPYEYAIDAPDTDAGFTLTYDVVKQIKANNPNTLLIDIGDVLQDNSAELFNDMDVHPMVEALNYMGYDLWVPGNHEFNFGLGFLERNINAFNGRCVASNIVKTDGTGTFVNSYQIFVIDGVRVAVVGGIAPHVAQWEASTPDHFQGLDFTDPVLAVKKTVASIEGQYDVLIAAMHLSRNGEYEGEGKAGVFQLAESVPEIDLILAGHEHATYCEKVNDTWVMEPGKYGAQVAFSEITVEKENGEWVISNIDAKNIPTKGLDPEAGMAAKFKFVHDESLSDAREQIGVITDNFVEGVDYITGEDHVTTMPTSQMIDTALIDLINIVQMKAAGAQVASCATFNSDQALFKGTLLKKDMAFIYKYSNTLMGVNMTGENLVKYMEWGVSFFNTYEEGDVTISFNSDKRSYNYDMFSGINYKVNVSKAVGHRIVNPTIDGAVINPSKIYKVAVNNYRFGTLLSNGWATAEDTYYTSANDVDSTIRSLIMNYVINDLNGKLSPVCDHNWELIGMGKAYMNKAVIAQIKSGKILIPSSEDGRTPNVKAVKLSDLK